MVRGVGDEPTRLTVVESGRYPDGSRIALDRVMAQVQIGDDAICTAVYDDADRVSALHVQPAVAPKAPPVWFAEIRENTAAPPAVNLLVFAGADVAPGVLLDDTAVGEVGVTSDDQLAALRWYPGSGEVDQVYVQPAWRRRNLATVLITAAGTLAVSRDWPRLWGDGQRTAQGESLRNASSWHARGADLTHLAPPMTPGEA